MKTKLTFAAFAVFITVTLVAQQHSKASNSAGTDANIIAKLTEIVQIREQVVEYRQALYSAGRASSGDVDGIESARIELAEARIDLAREQGQREALVNALQGLVAAHEQRVELAKNRKNLARASDVEIKEAQAALLKAQILLMREQK